MRANKIGRRGVRLLFAVGVWLLSMSVGVALSDPVTECEAEKLKAAGKRAECLAIEQAKARLGKSSDPARCEAGFDDDLATADAKAAQKGAACRFIDNQDGTISDLNTLLMWEKKDQATGVHDVDNLYTWAEAAEWAQNLNGVLSFPDNASVIAFAGHTDWRLPSLLELKTILVAPNCLISPCVDPVFNNGVDSFTAGGGKYWSSTTTSFIATKAQLVDFVGGVTMLGEDKSIPFSARAVRGNR